MCQAIHLIASLSHTLTHTLTVHEDRHWQSKASILLLLASCCRHIHIEEQAVLVALVKEPVIPPANKLECRHK